MGQRSDPRLSRARLGAYAMSVTVLLLGFAASYGAWRFTAHQALQRREAAFRHYVEQAQATVTARFAAYSTVVRAARGLFASAPKVNREAWRAFSRTLELPNRYPGISGLYYIAYVPEAARASFLSVTRADQAPDFTIQPAGDRPFYCPLTYGTPAELNAADLGFDACTSQKGFEALNAARHRDRVSMSAPLELEDAAGRPHRGVVLVAPVFQRSMPGAGAPPALRGWVGVSLPADVVMQGVIPENAPVALRIFDGPDHSDDKLIYGSGNEPQAFQPGSLSLPLTLDLDGRQWDFSFTDLSVAGHESLGIGAGGVLITLLIALGVFNLGRTRQRALALAARMTQELRDKEQLLSSITNNISDGIYRSNLSRGLVYVNEALAHIFGFESPQELLRVSGEELYADPVRREQLRTLLEQQGHYHNEEVLYRRKNGEIFYGSNSAVAVHDAQGRLLYFDGVISDITERKHTEQQVYRLAHYDMLTGLPNRVLLQDRLGQALREARRHSTRLALMFLDLDRFKDVNDSLGHEVGDRLLKIVARRLEECVRESDTVCRQGGDEFLLLLGDVADNDAAVHIAEKVLISLSQPYLLGSHDLRLTPSIGISQFPDDAADTETLIRNADAAMYHAKERGRANYQFYTRDMHVSVNERLSLENSLRLALERHEFRLYYQPQVELVSGRITGMEALIRWQHPTQGLVEPSRFIAIAEQSGLIAAIGEWVLRAACRQNRLWQQSGLAALPVAVNLSAIQLRRQNLDKTIALILDETGLDTRHLELELTESAVMHDSRETGDMLQRLNAIGVSLAIDDFGTGYSSLSYLKRFQIDRLKIDRTFVQDVTVDSDDAAITTAIISLARSLRVRTLAEGVETREQCQFLRQCGCDEVQGYYFSRPLPAEEFEALLRNPPHWAPEA